MPVPIVIIVTGVVSVLIGTIATFILITHIRGNSFCILGVREVGKTTLFTFLSTGKLYSTYKATVHNIKVAGRAFKIEEMNIKIKDSIDVSGGIDAYREWKRLFNESDYVMYLFRTDWIYPVKLTDVIKYFNVSSKKERINKYKDFVEEFNSYLDKVAYEGKRLAVGMEIGQIEEFLDCYNSYRKYYIERLKEDIDQINQWETENPKPIIYIGTHSDLIPDFNYMNLEKRGILYDMFRNELRSKVQQLNPENINDMILGTFCSEVEIQYYTKKAFKALKEKK